MQQSLPPLSDAFALFQAGRVTEGLRIVEGQALAGDPDALFTLGDMYWRGVGVGQDMRRGRDLFRQSAEAGQPMGVRAYTNLLASGIAGPRDWAGALVRLRQEARYDGLRARMLAVIDQMNLTAAGDPLKCADAEVLSDRPRAAIFRGGFSAAECDFLTLVAEPTYERSVVAMDGGNVRSGMRTSDGSTMHWLIEDPATHAINRRLAALSRTGVEQGEPLQILRYRPGQEYQPHVDWLGEGNRRIMTALIYLNDDYAGGETEFVKTGLRIKGRRGDTLVFSSITPEGLFEPLSEHAGRPIAAGTKYLASRWIREGRFSPGG